ncbi:lytic transglycosylase domain-containing protein [Pseudomonas koreensis]|jgi:soluble lytic murein transglycosylase-like protein|uniref:lytic transglycosylase domain-containing protein n=1 Tax=Pseudomonas koreensis TaxID=198620 RepID=UPI000E222ECE|nr:lytic transglycosylase domain-containing protein [Pseudomonas koreensis]MBP3998277.1 lytic transglycosylase domain-containing protein [Pseudomonas koreensis]
MRKTLRIIVFSTAVASTAPNVFAFDLRGTVWEEFGKPKALDPLLLYAVALQESRTDAGGSKVRPHPYAINCKGTGAFYPETRVKAEEILRRELKRTNLCDVGLMQVNIRWNGYRVGRVEDLFELRTNVKVGAQILREAIDARPGDMELAIGGYNTQNPDLEETSRDYARKVLSIWRRLQILSAKVN